MLDSYVLDVEVNSLQCRSSAHRGKARGWNQQHAVDSKERMQPVDVMWLACTGFADWAGA